MPDADFGKSSDADLKTESVRQPVYEKRLVKKGWRRSRKRLVNDKKMVYQKRLTGYLSCRKRLMKNSWSAFIMSKKVDEKWLIGIYHVENG